jgi:hypothetical protein
MYDFDTHELLGDKTMASAEAVVEIIKSFLDMAAVLDVGCGDGRWLSVCQANGAREIFGIDGPWTDPLRLLISTGNFLALDLSHHFDLGRRFSLAVSLEVAEHVESRYSEVFVDNLVRHSDVVLFGAAIPHQGGFRHVNEQWQSYWKMLFEARGFVVYDPVRSQLWYDGNVHFWYKQNILLYINERNAEANKRVSDYIRRECVQQLPADVVHPERYQAIATYETITSFKALVKQLPKYSARKLGELVRRTRQSAYHPKFVIVAY